MPIKTSIWEGLIAFRDSSRPCHRQSPCQGKTAMDKSQRRAEPIAHRIGYVVKRYPRFSETFVVNEILELEAIGQSLEVFALRPSNDSHFQDIISRVRAPINFLPSNSVKSGDFWRTCHDLGPKFPALWSSLADARHATVVDAFQAIKLAEAVVRKDICHLHAHFATSAATVARLAAQIAGSGVTTLQLRSSRFRIRLHLSSNPIRLPGTKRRPLRTV